MLMEETFDLAIVVELCKSAVVAVAAAGWKIVDWVLRTEAGAEEEAQLVVLLAAFQNEWILVAGLDGRPEVRV